MELAGDIGDDGLAGRESGLETFLGVLRDLSFFAVMRAGTGSLSSSKTWNLTTARRADPEIPGATLFLAFGLSFASCNKNSEHT